jgi:hypothetical protein
MAHWADSLTEKEVEGTLACVDVLKEVPWAAPLLAIARAIVGKLLVGVADREAYAKNPVSSAEKSFLFELRFAAALATAGVNATYEHGAGVGDSTVDFLVHLEPRPWLVELVSLHESVALKAATWSHVDASSSSVKVETFGFALGLDKEKPKQTDEGETLKAQERIGAKVFDSNGKKAVKFPGPGAAVHMLVVDARGFLGSGIGDTADWHHIVYGADGLRPELVKVWKDATTGKEAPIRGLLEADCPLPAAALVRERLHVIAFVCEKDFAPGELGKRMVFCWNPFRFESEDAAREALAHWPIQRRALTASPIQLDNPARPLEVRFESGPTSRWSEAARSPPREPRCAH